MNETFKGKGFGMKSWQITETGLVFKDELIPYAQLSKLELKTTPTTRFTNGVIQCVWNGKILTLAFAFEDKQRAHAALDFANKKIDEANGVVKGTKFTLRAHTGTLLEVYETYLTISHMQTGSLLKNLARGGALGEKRINFADLTSIQLKEPSGITVGFLQFAFPGSVESHGGIVDSINDENSIPIMPDMVGTAREIVNFIEKKRDELRRPQVVVAQQSASAADELLKFKTLLDAGVLTQEEFDTKKKELLGL